MEKYTTEQEKFWAGEFGDNYIERNEDKILVASNLSIFSKVFEKAQDVNSVIEFGSNIGLNLVAIKQLLPDAKISSVEINPNAVKELEKLNLDEIFHTSILDFENSDKKDFVFTKGVLIHINPDMLQKVYEKMYNNSKKYICMVEYYNPTPVEIPYRGHSGKLFKRNFAGEIMEKYPDLKLVDYGFFYHQDPRHHQEDLTWFLMEKRGGNE